MTKWTRALLKETASAFNAGETQTSIAQRLHSTVKAVSVAMCRARKLGITVNRRSGFPRKKGQPE